MRGYFVVFVFVFSGFTAYNQTITPAGPIQLCPGGNATLTASAGNSYQWLLNSSPIGGATGKTYIVTASGSYSVVITTSGVPATSPAVSVTVNSNPTVSFTSPGGTLCAASPVPFTSTVTNGKAPYTFAWSFGDGGTSSATNPSHSFSSFGCGSATLNNTLLVTDANGCTASTTKAISLNQAPDVQLQDQNVFSPFNNCENDPSPANPNYTITVNNTSPSNGCVTGYSLDWGDGTPTATGLTAASFPLTHTYTKVGAFSLVFSGTGTNGCTNSKTYTVANQSNPDIGIATIGTTEGCADLPVNILITNWQLNSPGTVYQLQFGDGNTKQMTHPINATNSDESIIYTYKTSSCPNPDFPLTISATNGCRTKVFTGGNIVVKTKPQAAFSVGGSGPACSGQQVCFTNETLTGYYNNCSTNTIYSWNFGDPASGASNTSTSASPCHSFSGPGTYTVTFTTSNPCGTSSTSKTVCVNAPAAPSFTLDKQMVCAGGSVTATNTSVPGSCVTAGYQWNVTYTPDYCGTGESWSFLSGSTATSTAPSFQFNNPGRYTLRLTVTGACGSNTSQQIVHVKQKPVVELKPIANVCGQATICPVATVTSCGTDPLTYLWEFDGGAAGTSDKANPGCIDFNTPGTHSISVSVTNECGTTKVTQTFSNNTGAELTVPAPLVLCGGSNTGVLSFPATPSGATITWTNSNPSIGIPASGTGNIPSFTAVNNTGAQITATISVTATLNDCPVTKSFTITVYPKPSTPAVTSPVNYCVGDPALALTASVSAGHTLRWFNTSTGGTGDPVLPTPLTTTPGTTSYYISQVNTTTGCESDRTAILVNVSLVPVITGTSTVNPATCASATGSIRLNGLPPSMALSVRYRKNNGTPVTVSLTADGSGSINITGLTAGTYSDITAINNACVSNIVGPFTLSDPNPPPAPTTGSDIALCEGTSLSLTASTTVSGATWGWTGPGGFTSAVQNPVIGSTVPANSGKYFATVTVNGCASAPAPMDVLVYPRPAAPAPDPTLSVCLQDDIHLTASTSFGGPVSWSWTGPGGFSSTDQNPVIPQATAAMNGTYKVAVTSNVGNCTSPAASTIVTVLPIPVITGSSFLNPVGCNSSTGAILLNGLLPSKLYTVHYTRNVNQQMTVNVSSAPDGTVIISGLQAGNYTDVRVSLNSCSSDIAGPFTLADTPPFSAVAETNGELCEGSTLMLMAHATSPGAALYTWTGPDGFSSVLQNPVIPNAGAGNAGVYEVTVTINGCSAKKTVTATVATKTIGGTTSANASVCPGQNIGIINLSGHHGNILRWESSINDGQSWEPVANTTPSLTYSDITVTTRYRAVVQSGPCTPAFSSQTVITVLEGVKPVRMQPVFIATCNHDTAVTFHALAEDAGSVSNYYWYINDQVAGTVNPFTYTFRSAPENPSPEIFEVYVLAENASGCNTRSDPGQVVIHALPTPQIQVSPSPVQREPHYTFVFTDISAEGINDFYTWDLGDTSQPKTGREITYDYKLPQTFKVGLFVEDRNTGCNARDSVNVTIVPVPGALQIPNAFYPGSNHPELRTFKLQGIGMKKYKLQIFDAWGKVVFETTELNADGSPKTAWNGRYMNTGRLLPQDAYVWKIVEIEFENGKPWNGMSHNGGPAKYFGNVTLFR